MKNILIKPMMTEKATAGSQAGLYTFIVASKANKVEIKSAIESTYSKDGVKVESVRTINYLGKRKNRNTKTAVISGRRPSYKKAIVKLANNAVIDIYEGL